jgi:hypothetical protein
LALGVRSHTETHTRHAARMHRCFRGFLRLDKG